MKTKPIVWEQGVHRLHFIAICGTLQIGSYIEVKTPKGNYVWAKSIFVQYEEWLKKSEARAWVEKQFQDFIKEVSA